jgi:hypothetical protein
VEIKSCKELTEEILKDAASFCRDHNRCAGSQLITVATYMEAFHRRKEIDAKNTLNDKIQNLADALGKMRF